eukprot:Skav232866  [mRNA]  locus=scaffold2451:218492:220212:+ [translate_table: standard]
MSHSWSMQQSGMDAFTLDQWISHVRTSGKSWKHLCGRVASKVAMLSHIQARTAEWQDTMNQLFISQGLRTLAPSAPPEPCGDFPCTQCSAVFETPKALSVHKLLMHSQHASVRAYMPYPSMCMSCRRDFYMQKHRQHLQYTANGCLAHLQAVLHPEPAVDFGTASNKQFRAEYRQPACRIVGPLLPSVSEWRLAAPWKVFPGPQQRADQSFSALACDLQSWFWADAANVDFPDLSGLSLQDREELTEPFLAMVSEVLGVAGSARFAAISALCAGRPVVRQPPPATSSTEPLFAVPEVESPLYAGPDGEYYVLYFYSGHMREGDVHTMADQFALQFGFRICVIPRAATGLYRAASAKPTTFLHGWLPNLPPSFDSHRVPAGQRPDWTSLTGKNLQGEWNTARAKAYPPAVNAALFFAFYESVAHCRETAQTRQIDCPRFLADVQAIYRSMQVSSREMGPD